MLHLAFSGLGSAATVLCIGAHCDDIEIGCGATLIRLSRENPGLSFVWGVFAGDHKREQESRSAASELLGQQRVDLRYLGFRESYFPSQQDRVKDAFESLKASVKPDLILTHRLDDRHQDHRVVAELTWNTFRSHLILEYEIPKYDGDLGSPNCFVVLDEETCGRKVEHLRRAFGSQRDKHWFADETFMGLMRLRGMECRAAGGYAEAFYSRKTVLEL